MSVRKNIIIFRFRDINLIVSTYNSVTKCVWPSLSYLRDLICPVIPTKVPWSVYDSIFVAVLPNALQKYNHKLFHYFHLIITFSCNTERSYFHLLVFKYLCLLVNRPTITILFSMCHLLL